MHIHIGNKIRQEIEQQERSIAWFARQIHVSRSHVYRIFEKESIDTELLFRIGRALNHDFFLDISGDIRNQIDNTSVPL